MLNLGCTLPNLGNICLHKSTDTKFYPFTETNKGLLKETWENALGGLLSFLHAKKLLMKLLFESLQTYANQLLGLMPAQYVHNQCVNPCLPVFIRIEISVKRQTDSHLDKIRPIASKVWSCTSFNALDQIVKSRASIQHAGRRKLTASVLNIFVLIAILRSKQWAAFTTIVPVKKDDQLALNRIINLVVKRGYLVK